MPTALNEIIAKINAWNKAGKDMPVLQSKMQAAYEKYIDALNAGNKVLKAKAAQDFEGAKDKLMDKVRFYNNLTAELTKIKQTEDSQWQAMLAHIKKKTALVRELETLQARKAAAEKMEEDIEEDEEEQLMRELEEEEAEAEEELREHEEDIPGPRRVRLSSEEQAQLEEAGIMAQRRRAAKPNAQAVQAAISKARDLIPQIQQENQKMDSLRKEKKDARVQRDALYSQRPSSELSQPALSKQRNDAAAKEKVIDKKIDAQAKKLDVLKGQVKDVFKAAEKEAKKLDPTSAPATQFSEVKKILDDAASHDAWTSRKGRDVKEGAKEFAAGMKPAAIKGRYLDTIDKLSKESVDLSKDDKEATGQSIAYLIYMLFMLLAALFGKAKVEKLEEAPPSVETVNAPDALSADAKEAEDLDAELNPTEEEDIKAEPILPSLTMGTAGKPEEITAATLDASMLLQFDRSRKIDVEPLFIQRLQNAYPTEVVTAANGNITISFAGNSARNINIEKHANEIKITKGSAEDVSKIALAYERVCLDKGQNVAFKVNANDRESAIDFMAKLSVDLDKISEVKLSDGTSIKGAELDRLKPAPAVDKPSSPAVGH